ncbi:MAG: XRE family transcriptional regulator [Oxalobacteraceae bacterium]|nr:MAG: XRE family transcriptional regulator [Oxalobacteraceae bacterium]
MTGSATDYAALFGRNFRAARMHAGLNIAEVSERTGLQLSTISAIEHGGLNVTIDSMGLLAEAIERPLAMLLEAGIEFIEDDVGS